MINKNFDLPPSNEGLDTSESDLDKVLRFVRGGAGIALGAVAIIEGVRSFKEPIASLRSGNGQGMDRLSTAQGFLGSALDVVRGAVDTRSHLRTIIPKK